MLIKSIGFVLILFFLLSAVIINTDPNIEIELGRKLFFDPILSIDSTISCASCHKPEFAFADNRPISPGVGGRLGECTFSNEYVSQKAIFL